MSKLIINVQADRLPDIEVKDSTGTLVPCAQVTLKVSAVVASTGALLSSAKDELLPWKWHSATSTTDPWNAHVPSAWTLWSYDPAAKIFTKLEAPVEFFKSVEVPTAFDVDSDADVNKRFDRRITEEIDDIVNRNGADAALRRPAEDDPTTSRTVFGLVESLSGLPFPVPAATNTVTAIGFAPPPDPAHLIIAAPNFAASSGIVYKLNLTTLTPGADVPADGATIEYEDATGAVFVQAIAEMHASLPANALPPAAGDDQRLLDLEDMIVRTPGGHAGVEAADWVASLPRRIGETIDPYARLLAVFDDTITQALADDDTAAKALGKVTGPLREALEVDLTPSSPTAPPPYRLLNAIDDIAWRVIGPRLVGSTTVPPPAATLLQAVADRKPSLANVVVERLAISAVTSDALTSDHRSKVFVSFAATRLARLLGMAIDELPDEVAASDRPEGFIATVVKHWTATNDAPPVVVKAGAGNGYRLGARRAIINKDQSAWPSPGSTDLAFEAEPLFDLTHLPAARSVVWHLVLRAIPATAFALEVAPVPAAAAAIAKVEAQPDPGGMKLTLTLLGGTAPAVLVVQTGQDVSLALDFSVTSATNRTLGALLASGSVSAGRIETHDVALERAPFSFQFTASGADLSLVFPILEAPTALADELRRVTSSEALRASLALEYAGPYVEGILSGRTTWNGPGVFSPGTIGERIQASVKALTTIGMDGANLYTRSLDAALAAVGLPARSAAGSGPQELIRDLLVKLMTDAAAASAVLARMLIPPTMDGSTGGGLADQARRLTPDATPLVLRIDQLQAFDVKTDLWARIAGIGVLVARTPDKAQPVTSWHSLNVARLHVPRLNAAGVREPLDAHNAVRVAGGPLDEKGALIDPAAQQIAEVSGVRSALVSYDNRSLVAAMAEDQSLMTPDGVMPVARRIEAYGAPPKAGGIRLPALSFGHVFHLAPYVIGQGGALPPWLRADTTQPFQRIEKPEDIKPPAAAIRQAIYRRTRGVGMPVLLPPRVLPGVPEGVVPLAGELAIRPPPMSIGQTVQGRFFVSEDGQSGIIDPVPAGAGERSGLRIELGGLTFTAAGPLKMTLYGRRVTGETPEPLAELVIPSIATGSRLRVDVFSDGWHYSTATGEPPNVEDEPAFSTETVVPDANLSGLDHWRAVAIYVSAETTTVSFEAPLLTFLVKAGAAEAETLGRPRIAPESSHTQRSVHVLDGIKRRGKIETGRENLTLRFRRPTVDYGTYERWLNAAVIEGLADRGHVDSTLVVAKRLAEDEDTKVGEARSFDDPAVTAVFVELVRIFPRFESLAVLQAGAPYDTIELMTGFTNDGKPKLGLDRTVRVETQLQNAAKDGLAVDGAALVARVLPGCSYELRVYGGVPAAQSLISKIEPAKRLSQAVRGVMRAQGATGPGQMLLGAALVLTFEVATETMPADVYQGDVSGAPRIAIAVLRPPKVAAEVAHVALNPDFAKKEYQRLRYCGSVGLIPQRWSWRGRPQDDDWSQPEHIDRFDIGFSDRRVDDVGMILTRRLERAHVYNGRKRLTDPAPMPIHDPVSGPPLFEKDLDWRLGIALWRFGVRFESRYAPMRPGDAEFVRFTHRAEGKTPVWNPVVVRDRATGRTPKRPGFTLALPLTEPMMASGAVPPLLLLFDEGFHANFHAGDGIEVTTEVARHPFTERERIEARIADTEERIKKLEDGIAAVPPPENIEEMKDELERGKVELAALEKKLKDFNDNVLDVANLKYWTEHGPDPTRSGTGSEGELLPIRVDGPIGYTFDAGTEAGRIDHTGFLVSPVRPRAWPWSLVKLRCRRIEAPEGLDPASVLTPGGPAAFDQKVMDGLKLLPPKPIRIAEHSIWRVANNSALLAAHPAIAGEAVFATEHEGLVIDLGSFQLISAGGSFTFDFANEPNPKLDKEVSVSIASNSGELTISLATALGPAGVHKVSIPPDQTAQLRLVLSLRDKPQDGDKYRPAGDISVRLRVSASDGVVRESTDRWLAIASAPLVSSHLDNWLEINKAVQVQIAASGDAANATVRPVRLSGFTPPVWCQFTESMSVFHASVADGGGIKAEHRILAYADLVAKLGTGANETKLTITFGSGAQSGAFEKFKLAGLHPLDALARATGEVDTAQIEEVLIVLVTRYVRDVFDRIRERPVAIKPLGEPAATGLIIDLAQPDWPKKSLKGSDIGSAGRIRLLRLLRPKLKEDGGFLAEVPKFPQDYFNSAMLDGRLDMNPADAKGIMLGMSMPIEWQR